MYTPYDWQEGIGNRAQYIEGKLAHGAPVLAISAPEGIVVFTYRRQARKIYEIYDRLLFAAIGQQSDVEALRTAAVDFAHQEGYNRSEQDVTIQRVATALSAPLKKAFADFSTAPVIARSLFAEVGETPDDDQFYVLDYDGDYSTSRRLAVVAGTPEQTNELQEKLAEVKLGKLEKAPDVLSELWQTAMRREDIAAEELMEGLTREVMLLERATTRENRFRVLS